MTRKGSAFSRAAEHAKNSKQKPARATPLHDRFTRIEEARQAVRTNTLRVDPSTCRLWSRHNRKFDRLNETNCRDLIESFISAGRQEIPRSFARRPTTPRPPTRSSAARDASGPCGGFARTTTRSSNT